MNYPCSFPFGTRHAFLSAITNWHSRDHPNRACNFGLAFIYLLCTVWRFPRLSSIAIDITASWLAHICPVEYTANFKNIETGDPAIFIYGNRFVGRFLFTHWQYHPYHPYHPDIVSFIPETMDSRILAKWASTLNELCISNPENVTSSLMRLFSRLPLLECLRHSPVLLFSFPTSCIFKVWHCELTKRKHSFSGFPADNIYIGWHLRSAPN